MSWGQVSRGLELQATSLLSPYWHDLHLPWFHARSSCFVPSAPAIPHHVKSSLKLGMFDLLHASMLWFQVFLKIFCCTFLCRAFFCCCCWIFSKDTTTKIINYLNCISCCCFFQACMWFRVLVFWLFPPFRDKFSAATFRLALLEHLGSVSRPCQFCYLRQASSNSLSDPISGVTALRGVTLLNRSQVLSQQGFERNVTPAVDTIWCVRRGT